MIRALLILILMAGAARAQVSFTHGGSGLTDVTWNTTNFLKAGIPALSVMEWRTLADAGTNLSTSLSTSHSGGQTLMTNALARFTFTYASTNDEFFIGIHAANVTTNFVLSSWDFDVLQAQFPGAVRMFKTPYSSEAVTVTPAADTVNLTEHHLINGQTVTLACTNCPGGITSGRLYLTRDIAAGTFKLTETYGGSALDITSAGAGGITLTAPAPFADYYAPSINYGGLNALYLDHETAGSAFHIRTPGQVGRLTWSAASPWTNATISFRARADFLVAEQDRLVRSPILPGQSRNITLGWTFSAATNARAATLAGVIQPYTNQLPNLLTATGLTNRAPLIYLVTTSHSHRGPLNPGGFTGQPTGNVYSATYYRQKLFEYLTNAVTHASNFGAQAIIFWSLEGEEAPHPVSYAGDPRQMPWWQTAQLTDMVAFVTNNSVAPRPLKLAFTLRPQVLKRGLNDGAVSQVDLHSEQATMLELSNKVAFMMGKTWSNWVWGFYIDSSNYGDPNAPLSPLVFEALHANWPGLVFMPEQLAQRTWRVAPGYRSYAVHGAAGPPADVSAIYTNAYAFTTMDSTNWLVWSNEIANTVASKRTGFIIPGDQPPADGLSGSVPFMHALSNIWFQNK